MKSYHRTAATLARSWKIHRDDRSGWHRPVGANLTTSEGAKEEVAECKTDSGEIVDKNVLRKLLKEFAVSGTIKRVAKDYLLTGMKVDLGVCVCVCLCVCV